MSPKPEEIALMRKDMDKFKAQIEKEEMGDTWTLTRDLPTPPITTTAPKDPAPTKTPAPQPVPVAKAPEPIQTLERPAAVQSTPPSPSEEEGEDAEERLRK
jgi:hypothetical protein